MKPDASRISRKITDLGCQRDADLWRLDFEGLSPPDQVFLAIWELKSEVYNGGLWQYFINWSGRLVPFIPQALSDVDANQVMSIVKAAIELVGPDVPWDDEMKRFPIINGLSKEKRERLWGLDKQLSGHFEELDVLLFHYLSQHRDQVDAPVEFWTEAVIQ